MSAEDAGPVGLTIVTGDSSGLGAALARTRPSGWSCLGVSRRHSDEAFNDPERDHIAADLSDPEAILAVADAIATRCADLPDDAPIVLWNNAGTLEPEGFSGHADPRAIIAQQILNTAAPMALADAVLKATAGRIQPAVLVQIGSGAAFKPYRGWSGYGASKAALVHWTRIAGAEQLDRYGALAARVLCVAPGVVDTPMQGWIRAHSEGEFPDRARFIALKNDGDLVAPEDAARGLWRAALDTSHETGAILDLRDL